MTNQGAVNYLCEQCRRNCKQEASVKVLGCRLFLGKPQQMELRFNGPAKEKKRTK